MVISHNGRLVIQPVKHRGTTAKDCDGPSFLLNTTPEERIGLPQISDDSAEVLRDPCPTTHELRAAAADIERVKAAVREAKLKKIRDVE